MAFPVDADRVTTNSTVSGTSHSLNLPGSLAAGDLLIAVARCPDATTISWPAGWTEWEETSADASTDSQAIAARVADGTEGATITVTLGTARILVGLCYRITGAAGAVLSTVATGSGSQPNSPNLVAATAAQDILWLSIGGADDTATLTSGPASYANATVQGSTASGSAGVHVYGASRQLNAASENPGAWTMSVTSTWMAWTVALATTAFPSRLTQEPVETLVLPTSGQARATQEPVEALVLPTSGKARATQVPVEALVFVNNAKVRLTQDVVEVLILPTDAQVRETQGPVEVLRRRQVGSVFVAIID